eukprot:scaffold654_cov207-Ochromonas_danica.AAC.52
MSKHSCYMLADDEYKSLVERVKQNVKPGSVVVIKYGGHAMDNEALKELFLEDVAELYRTVGVTPVIVHGGGPQIAQMLTTLNVPSQFVDGLRVTDTATMDVAQMVLCGSINKQLVRRISSKKGVKGAVGLSGLDSKLIEASIKDPKLGLVGEPSRVNTELIHGLVQLGYIPVIAPVGYNIDGSGSLNCNADTAAGAVAEALKANVFLLLTDIVGVLDKEKKLIENLSVARVQELRADGTIFGGMIPKLETATRAVEAGVGAVSIMDGRIEHGILRALSGEKFGTVIHK